MIVRCNRSRVGSACLVLGLGSCTGAETPERPAIAAPVDAFAEAGRACVELRERLKSPEIDELRSRQSRLGCDEHPEDPACVAFAQQRARHEGEIQAFAQAHDPELPASSRTIESFAREPCTYPREAAQPMGKPPTASKPRSRPPRPAPKPRVPDEALPEHICFEAYAQLAGWPGLDRALLADAWPPSACLARHAAIEKALGEAWVAQVRPRWRDWPEDDGVAPWEVWEHFPPAQRTALKEGLSIWCREGGACSILGRCGAKILPGDHPLDPGAVACVASSDEDCRASRACAVEGRCALDPVHAWCVPGSDRDCAASELCASRGACRRVEAQTPGLGETASCGETTPATSGYAILGRVHNPSLPPRVAAEL